MSGEQPIEDYYGTTIEVQPLFGSPGPMVDIEFSGDSDDFVRLTPEQARELAQRLLDGAKEVSG